MRFPSATALFFLFVAGAVAGPIGVRDDDDHSNDGLPRICRHLQTKDRGCLRYVQGFDVTGVLTEVDLTFDTVKTKCDCIQECMNRPATCANWVYKFSTPDSITIGHRTCTLYSDFNLPSNVIVNVDVADSTDVLPIGTGNNPHNGGPVPQAFKDAAGTVPDDGAFSGEVWQLSDGSVVC